MAELEAARAWLERAQEDLRAEESFAELLDGAERLLASPPAEDGQSRYRDVVAALLSFLAERMTALQEARDLEARSFLSWLEGELGCSVDDLTGRTQVREYYRQPEGVERLLQVIERDRKAAAKLDVSQPRGYGAHNPSRALVIEGYERSMTALGPILRQLELTDRLIDLLVYRLYGLAPTEVERVEEATRRT